MTEAEAGELVAVLQAAFPRAEVDEATLKVYSQALRDLDIDEARTAVWSVVRTSRFFPTVAEIRGEYLRRFIDAPSPAEAWAQIERADKSIGGLPHPLVREAFSMVGGRWALKTSDNLVALRAHFWRIYDDLVAGAKRRVDEGRPMLPSPAEAIGTAARALPEATSELTAEERQQGAEQVRELQARIGRQLDKDE